MPTAGRSVAVFLARRRLGVAEFQSGKRIPASLLFPRGRRRVRLASLDSLIRYTGGSEPGLKWYARPSNRGLFLSHPSRRELHRAERGCFRVGGCVLLAVAKPFVHVRFNRHVFRPQVSSEGPGGPAALGEGRAADLFCGERKRQAHLLGRSGFYLKNVTSRLFSILKGLGAGIPAHFPLY